jgi:hypothetical protein
MAERTDKVASGFAIAAQHITPVPGAETWTYGLGYEDYRASGRAVFDGPLGPSSFTGEGLSAFEDAMRVLLGEPAVRQRWQQEELWGLMASMLAAAAASAGPPDFIGDALKRIRGAGQALTIVLIANVSWPGPPLEIAGMVVGSANESFLDSVREVSAGRTAPTPEQGQAWLRDQVAPRPTHKPAQLPVALASWGWGQSQRAGDEVERQVSNLVDLCLLLEPDLRSHQVFRRGPTNRPGVRGLTLDRGALEASLSGDALLELSSSPLVVQELPLGGWVSWAAAEPLPLGDLLVQPGFKDRVIACFGEDPVAKRLRIAARWFAESHYASGTDDAALALGVALDSLLSGKDALPGSALADRFAMLSPAAQERSERVATYLRLYKIRSSVAHGGTSTALDGDGGGLAVFTKEVQWAASRLLALRDRFAPSSEADIKSCFDELRWGARDWSP